MIGRRFSGVFNGRARHSDRCDEADAVVRPRPIKALFVCTGLPVGGAERQWASLIPHLVDRGVQASVVALRSEGPVADELREAGIQVAFAGMRSRYDAPQMLRGLRDAGSANDVIVSRSIDAHIVGQIIAARSHSAQVATEHTAYDLLPLRRHQRALYRLVAPRVDAAVAVTQAQIPALAKLGYEQRSIKVIPNGVSAPTVRRAREDVRRSLGLAADDVVFCAVATLRQEKRLDVFVDAVMRAHCRDPRVRGLVVGAGPEASRIGALAGATDGVVLALGARADVGDLLSASDAACLSSVHEALPLSLLEAASLGLPLVATDVGGTGEIVRPGETGYLVPAGDVDRFVGALTAIASDSEEAARLGHGARARQERFFSHRTMVDAYEALLRVTVARSSSKARRRR